MSAPANLFGAGGGQGTPTPFTPVIPGSKTLIMGPPGAGKTTCLRTIPLDKYRVVAVFTEPNALIVCGREWLDKIHWAYVGPTVSGWDVVKTQAERIKIMPTDELSKGSGDKNKYTQFLSLINQFNRFVDQEGADLGDVTKFGTDTVLVLDSLTGLSNMARQLVGGHKTNLSIPEWGIGQDMISKVIDKITTTASCHFILTAHIVYSHDEVLGGVKFLIDTLGNKLAPRIPIYFNNVVLAQADQGSWTWATSSSKADLKVNNLPPNQGKLPQNLAILLADWEAKNKGSSGLVSPAGGTP